MENASKPYSPDKKGLRLAVRVVPKASRTGIDGIIRGANGLPALQIRLAAPPSDGEANEALIDFLAEALDLHKAAIVIKSGEKVRIKLLLLSGDPAKIAPRVDALLSQQLSAHHGQMPIGGLAAPVRKPTKPSRPDAGARPPRRSKPGR